MSYTYLPTASKQAIVSHATNNIHTIFIRWARIIPPQHKKEAARKSQITQLPLIGEFIPYTMPTLIVYKPQLYMGKLQFEVVPAYHFAIQIHLLIENEII